jgi:hypothetical protein
MSSKSTNNINVRGLILNLLHEGFDLISSLKEITDNSIGASAKRIIFFIDLKNHTIYVLDNGAGMNKQELTKLATLNDRKEGSSTRQGKYGQGAKLSIAFLTQLKYPVTIISKTNNPGQKSTINEIVIDFPEGIRSGEYDPRAERVSEDNEDMFKQFTGLFVNKPVEELTCSDKKSVEEFASGTLIKIKMDKRKFKELYCRIVSTEISPTGSIIYEIGVINQLILTNKECDIEFHLKELIKDNEPSIEVHQSVCFEACDDDDRSIVSCEEQSVTTLKCTSSAATIFDDERWDVECSENFDAVIMTVIPIDFIDTAEIVHEHICFVLENSRGDKLFLLKIGEEDMYEKITPDNLNNVGKKRETHSGTIEEIAARKGYNFKDTFTITLAYSEDWVDALEDEICAITENDLPPTKSPERSKLMSHIKGHRYIRNGTCALDAKLKASHTQGGDRAQRKFDENIIVCVKYNSNLDTEFGVTVKKFSIMEEIVDQGILTILYYLKKRWATDYNRNRVKKNKADAAEAKALEAQALKDAEDEEEEDDISCSSSGRCSSGRSSGRSSRSGSNIEFDIEIEEPVQILRSSSISILIKKGELLYYLNDWCDENVHMAELEDAVNFMCREYQLYKPSVADMVLAALTLPQKIQQLVAEIHTRYMSDRDPALCGADFYRRYEHLIKNK